MSAPNMTACNQGNNPIFVRGHSETHIDITFASSSIVNRITYWRVLEEESLSLHKYIAFDVLSIPRKLDSNTKTLDLNGVGGNYMKSRCGNT